MSSSYMIISLTGKKTDSSDDDTIAEEINVEKNRVMYSEVRGPDVIEEEWLGGSEGEERLAGCKIQEQNAANQEEKVNYPCNCGHNGPIVNHLRLHPQCLQVLKSQVNIGDKMSDEQFCVQTAMLIGECPALPCPGGDHKNTPNSCVKWWQSTGWQIMDWEGQAKDATSDLIKERTRRFVKDLENDHARQQEQANQSEGNRESNWSFLSQWKRTGEERLMKKADEELNKSFDPHSFSTPKEVYRDDRSGEPGGGSSPDLVK